MCCQGRQKSFSLQIIQIRIQKKSLADGDSAHHLESLSRFLLKISWYTEEKRIAYFAGATINSVFILVSYSITSATVVGNITWRKGSNIFIKNSSLFMKNSFVKWVYHWQYCLSLHSNFHLNNAFLYVFCHDSKQIAILRWV